MNLTQNNVGKTIWFTGLSGSGKSTLSSKIKQILEERNVSVVLLDGDVLRSGLNRDLGFSAEDRAENIRRAGETAKILSEAGHTVIAAFITPLETLRMAVRNLFDPDRYIEIYLECSINVCEDRDPKGLYRRARQGEIPNFTGISSPFEIPQSPDLLIRTDHSSPEQATGMILDFLEKRFPDIRTDQAPPCIGMSKSSKRNKVAVIGLDGVPASLIFERFKDRLPTFRLLMEHGSWGPLKSTEPPITIPAWTCMTTGKDPGELGIYGFRNRQSYDYEQLSTMDSTAIRAKRIWDYVEEAGGSSILVGIPQTFPARAHRGITICGFPAPRESSEFTYPGELGQELDDIAGGLYLEDIREFRNRPLGELAVELREMVERRFKIAGRLLITNPWDFFMMVEIAPDRAHHTFWRFFDPEHPRYAPGSEYEDVIPKFYEYLDAKLNSLLALMDDDTTVVIVSDHGAMPCHGGVCINQWLIDNGYLVLKEPVKEVARLEPEMIDWDKTTVWSEGGYYARIFLNVKGREPKGVIEPTEYEAFRDELAGSLRIITERSGESIYNDVLKPDEIYAEQLNVAPDLMVYFDGLKRRALSSIDSGKVFVDGSAYSLDDCNHDPLGIFILTKLSDLRTGKKRDDRVNGLTWRDISSITLDSYGTGSDSFTLDGMKLGDSFYYSEKLEINASYIVDKGHEVIDETRPEKGFSAEEQEIIKKRLEELGYI